MIDAATAPLGGPVTAELEGLLRQPYPGRQAASRLRTQIVQYLRTAKPSAGARFLTEAELVRISNLSRSTVRRALRPLQDQGLIERRVGAGTFVADAGARRPAGGVAAGPTAAVDGGLVRLAVVVYGIGDLSSDWYTPRVLEGISLAADEQRVAVELLGGRAGDVDDVSRRLERSRPDVLACLSDDPRHAFVIRDAQRLGIPVLSTGTPHAGLGLPVVCEDNRHGAAIAVEHLVARGHRAIALVLQRAVEPWVFDRHEAFLRALADAGLGDAADGDAAVCWLPAAAPATAATDEQADVVARFLARRGATAVVSGSELAMRCVDRLHAAGRLRVPHDVSVVSFEQNTDRAGWLGGLAPTTVELPLREMGRLVAHYARDLAERRAVPRQTTLACAMACGQSVAARGRALGL